MLPPGLLDWQEMAAKNVITIVIAVFISSSFRNETWILFTTAAGAGCCGTLSRATWARGLQ
jgi:hypothetical protein